MEIHYILLDLDNTLYPASAGLQSEIGRRMTRYVAELLHITQEDAQKKRREYLVRHGTTLSGLVKDNHLEDVEAYLECCHPEKIEQFLKKDPALKETLSSLSVPLSILTNSPIEHACRVLEFLEIRNLFEHIFDIRFNRFIGKPSKYFFRRVLEIISKQAEEVLFIDDMVGHLVSFQELGGNVLLVDEREESSAAGIPSIRGLNELPEVLSSLSGKSKHDIR
jgi:putative hydrolase of the HAD superfamily